MNTDDLITLRGVKSYWQAFWVREQFEGKPTKYSGTFLIEKKNTAMKSMLDAEIAKKIGSLHVDADKRFLRDGDNLASGGQKSKLSYLDHWVVRSLTDTPPHVIDHEKQKVLESKGNNIFLNGAIVDVVINIWAHKHKNGNRVCSTLYGVKWVTYGEDKPIETESPYDPDEINAVFDGLSVVPTVTAASDDDF